MLPLVRVCSTRSDGATQIDSLFQALPTPPSLHVIVEPHPDVLAHMRELGWFDKPNVRILEGKWQDFVDGEELLGVGGFDVVYTDTFSEDYKGAGHLHGSTHSPAHQMLHRSEAVL